MRSRFFTAIAGADADSHNHLGIGHLGVELLHHVPVLVVHAAGDEEDIRVFGVSGVDDAKALQIIPGRRGGQHFDVAAVAAGSVVVQDPGRFRDLHILSFPAPLKHLQERQKQEVAARKDEGGRPAHRQHSLPPHTGEGVVDQGHEKHDHTAHHNAEDDRGGTA